MNPLPFSRLKFHCFTGIARNCHVALQCRCKALQSISTGSIRKRRTKRHVFHVSKIQLARILSSAIAAQKQANSTLTNLSARRFSVDGFNQIQPHEICKHSSH